MKAVHFSPPGGLDALRMIDLVEPPPPAAGEITVKLAASSLNYHDYAVVAGLVPVAGPRIPLTDGAGVVVAVGAAVSEFVEGDSVVSTFFTNWLDGERIQGNFGDVPGDGIDGYARELVTVPATMFTRAPKNYSHAEAATLTCAGLAAWRAVAVNGDVMAGETVLVLGTGGVSVFALQFAKAMGARVIATSSSDKKLDHLRSLGADHLINYKEHSDWGARARELSGGRGVDHVIEIGGPGTLAQSLEALRIGGHIAIVGMRAGFDGQLPAMEIIRKQARLIGLAVGSRRQQLDMIRAIEATGIRPVIDETRFNLDNLAAAFRYQLSGVHVGKIIVNI